MRLEPEPVEQRGGGILPCYTLRDGLVGWGAERGLYRGVAGVWGLGGVHTQVSMLLRFFHVLHLVDPRIPILARLADPSCNTDQGVNRTRESLGGKPTGGMKVNEVDYSNVSRPGRGNWIHPLLCVF